MEEDHRESSNIRLATEKLHGNKRVLSDSSLTVDKGEDHNASDDEKRNDLCGIPREDYTAEVKPKEYHQGEAEEGEDAPPVHGFYTVDEACVLVLDVEVQHD